MHCMRLSCTLWSLLHWCHQQNAEWQAKVFGDAYGSEEHVEAGTDQSAPHNVLHHATSDKIPMENVFGLPLGNPMEGLLRHGEVLARFLMYSKRYCTAKRNAPKCISAKCTAQCTAQPIVCNTFAKSC